MSQQRLAELLRIEQQQKRAISTTLRKARATQQRDRQTQNRRQEKNSELAAAVFVLTLGDAQVHRQFCDQANLDASHSYASLNKYVMELSETKLEELFETYTRGTTKVARMARKFVEEHSLIQWIDSLNMKVGFAPQFSAILAQRREIAADRAMLDVPAYANKTTERQWTRRFVRNNSLFRGRIPRQPNGSRAQLLDQARNSASVQILEPNV